MIRQTQLHHKHIFFKDKHLCYNMKKRVNWKVFITCIVIVYFIGYIGSLFTSNSVNTSWYEQTRPEITPPNWIFPIVWNLLFFAIAMSIYLAWTKSNKTQKEGVLWLFGINLVLNLLWSLFYFTLKNPTLAFIDLLLILFSIISLMYFTNKINKLSSYLLIPYLLWISFAGILNYLSI